MKKNIARAALLFCATALITLPLLASASSAAGAQVHSNIWDPTILKGPLVICTGTGNDAYTVGDANVPALPPCQDLCDFVAQVLNIIYFAIAIVIWIIIPIDVAVGGIMYMLAGANPGMVTKAKTILLGAAWAIAITLCSYIIVATFVKVMGIAGVGGFDPNNPACTLSPTTP